MKSVAILLLFLATALFLPVETASQCSMCKAVVESGSDGDLAKGVNNGIIYMMGFPYLLVLIVGLIWYKKFLKTNRQ